MAASSLSGSLLSSLPSQFYMPNSSSTTQTRASSLTVIKGCTGETPLNEKSCRRRRPMLAGIGTLVASLFSRRFAFAEEVPKNYRAFVDFSDGYSYYYPSDWREFDFRGHDSAFKDRSLPLQNVRVSFKPTNKVDIHDLGPMEEVIPNLVRNVYAAPTQKINIFDMQEVHLTRPRDTSMLHSRGKRFSGT